MRKRGQISRRTHYRRLKEARKFGCPVECLPDRRGRHGKQPQGREHYRWNDGMLQTSRGYRLVRVGRSHPLADPNGYAPEHGLVVAAAFGLEALSGKVVHHKNRDRTDNRLENLSLLTLAQHNALHNAADDKRGPDGRFRKAAGRQLDGRTHDEMPRKEKP